jgi:Spy/CpxP family protein refolding chaperone
MKGDIIKAIKSKHILLLTAALLILTSSAFAQQARMQPGAMGKQGMRGKEHAEHMPMIPDLTEKQKEQIKELRTEHLKAMLPLKNQLMEKRARLRTLSTSEKVDIREVNSVIEEIGTLKTKIMKEQAAHRQDVRTLLTEEQRLFFDARHHPRPHSQYHR